MMMMLMILSSLYGYYSFAARPAKKVLMPRILKTKRKVKKKSTKSEEKLQSAYMHEGKMIMILMMTMKMIS